MSNYKYIVKNLTPWMIDELIAFSQQVNFDLILLRKPDEFYINSLRVIEKNGVRILVKPYKYKFRTIRKLIVSFKFLIRMILKFYWGYNFIIGFKSIFWFMKLDLTQFSKESNIHAQFATQASIISLLIKDFYDGKPVFSFTFHAYDIYFSNKWFNVLMSKCQSAFSISEYNINYVKEKYKDSNKLILSRLGVFRDTIELYKIKSEKFTLGILSWFVKKKGIIYLLNAMKILKSKGYNDIELVLAGDGPLKEVFLDYIKTNDLNSTINYIGKLSNDKKNDFFNSLDVFVLPSIKLSNDQDGIPVVLMEAVAYKLPLISTNVSGIPEICSSDYNGNLIEEKNVEALVSSIEGMYLNEKKREVYAQNSFKISEKYDIVLNSELKLKHLNWN